MCERSSDHWHPSKNIHNGPLRHTKPKQAFEPILELGVDGCQALRLGQAEKPRKNSITPSRSRDGLYMHLPHDVPLADECVAMPIASGDADGTDRIYNPVHCLLTCPARSVRRDEHVHAIITPTLTFDFFRYGLERHEEMLVGSHHRGR